ncbi:hypothetical protein TKWG_04790 [Advenella kashmirensis WT001]|uniref:Uncharacterized protein n=1 Tax=Advenella kashmirensis (strain DSM 17095 / LMG 22695 / WT001) TaxID=1036672 RepID=I3U8Z1_ADVKW|nr:hypothetical protein TKWG_04790 [Advenella kashmirensis WT001]
MTGTVIAWVDGHQAWLLFATVHFQKNAGAIEKTVGLIQMGAAHRQIPGVYPIIEREAAGAGRYLPSVIIQFFDGQHRSACLCRQAVNMPGKIPYQIAAWNPCRQRHNLAATIGVADGDLDIKIMSGGVGGCDLIGNGRHTDSVKFGGEVSNYSKNRRFVIF